jgi:phenylalanyl-tRNA synthetase beta chain
MPLTANLELRLDRKRDVVRRLKDQLIDVGFTEVINYVFQAPEENLMADPGGKPLSLKNPLGKDFSVMKNSLLAGLLKNTAANANQSLEQVALFEVGNAFGQEGGRVSESQRLALSACGLRQRKDWRLAGEVYDFACFKSLLTALGRRLRVELGFRTTAHPAFSGDSCFAVLAKGRECGVAGEVAPDFIRYYKLERPVFAAEIDLDALIAEAGESRFRPWRRYPSVRRDFTFLIPTAVRYEQLAETIERLRPKALESYELNDVFRGASVPKDKVSFSMAFTYRAAERTLTNEEVNEIHREFAAKLAGKLHLFQR